MGKNEFLSQLRKKLKRLPQAEIDSAVSYYEEYLSEAGQENERHVLNELGSPSVVASKIIGEFAMSDAATHEGKSLKWIWIVILSIFASPIALPLAIGIAVVVFSLIIVLFSVLLAVSISGVALAASGLLFVVTGFWLLFSEFATAMFLLGLGLLTAAIGVSILIGVVKLAEICVVKLQKLLGRYLVRRGVK